LQSAERELLARHFAAQLGQATTRASLALAARDLKPKSWWTTGDEKQKHYWLKTAQGYLTELEAEIACLPEQTEAAVNWPSDLAVCARSLGFTQVKLVLDIDDKDVAQQVGQDFLPQLRRWNMVGLTALVFLPADIELNIPAGLETVELTWNKLALTEMLNYRWRALAGTEAKAPADLFETSGWGAMLQACVESKTVGAPRRFMALWNTVTEAMPPGKERIGVAAVRAAMRSG
jgi:hypothetical protein